MIIHIGENVSLLEQDVIAIVDIDTALESKDTRIFIDDLIKKDCLVNTLEKNIKTYIITSDRIGINRAGINKYKLYVSSISSKSLLKRININALDWGNING